MELVKNREFKLDKSTFCSIHSLVARNEALEWGHFRGEGLETQFTPEVALGERGRFTPLATEPGAIRLNEVFANGIRLLEQNVANPFERATAVFLFGSLQQFFFDGNKRTSRFMMNGVLMSEGVDAVSIPAVRAAEFNSRMVNFYTSRDATEMMAFVLDCHPEASQIRRLNPGLSAVRDLPDIKYFNLSDPMTQANYDAHSKGQVNLDAAADIEDKPSSKQQTRAASLEETRREAAASWRRNYYDKRANQVEARADEKKTQPERDTGLDFDPES
jgi:hypothetical protein